MTMDNKYTDGLPADMQEWVASVEADDQREIARTWAIAALAADPVEEKETQKQVSAVLDRINTLDASRGDRSARVQKRADRSGSSRRRTMLRVAAVALGIALLCAVWVLVPVTETAPRGDTAIAMLPDGSRVELSGGTSMSYRAGLLGSVRRVQVQGEAFFDVARDPKPFVVETFNSEVRVLGTRFSVRAFDDAFRPATSVVVEEGTVQFRSTGRASKSVLLEARGFSRLGAEDDTPSDPVDVNVRQRMAWRYGEVAFENQPLADVISDIERRYDVAIRLETNALRNRRITLYRGDEATAKDIVSDLCGFFALECDLNGATWTLRRPADSRR